MACNTEIIMWLTYIITQLMNVPFLCWAISFHIIADNLNLHLPKIHLTDQKVMYNNSDKNLGSGLRFTTVWSWSSFMVLVMAISDYWWAETQMVSWWLTSDHPAIERCRCPIASAWTLCVKWPKEMQWWWDNTQGHWGRTFKVKTKRYDCQWGVW